MIQSDFGFLPLLAIIPIYLLVFRLKPKMAQIVSFTFGLLLATSTFFIAAIKFHSNTIALIFQHFFSATTLQLSLTSVLLSFIDTFVQFLSTSYLCLPVLLAGVVLLYIAFKIRKKYPQERTKQIIFLEIWTMSILLLVIINHGNGDTLFFFAPILFSTAILLANILVMTFPSPVVLTIVLLVLFSFQMLRNGISISSQDSYLIIQPGMIYSTETQVIDYTYQQAHGQPFVINAITNPLYIATMWSYLYQFYGKSHYGYMPYWGGRSQADQLGSLPENPNTIPLRFLIIDPTDIDMIPPFWVTKITNDEDVFSSIQEEKKIGQFTVQKRLSRH
jgi:hypothetical protein